MYETCPYCHGHGVIQSALSVSVKIQRQIASVMRKCKAQGDEVDLQVLVAPIVLDRMRREDEKLMVELQHSYGGHLSFRSEPLRHPETFEIRTSAGKTLYATGESTR